MSEEKREGLSGAWGRVEGERKKTSGVGKKGEDGRLRRGAEREGKK